jgi:hypothetical protein
VLVADPHRKIVFDMSAKAGSMALTGMFLAHAGHERDPDLTIHEDRRRYSDLVDLKPAAIRSLLLTEGREGYHAFKFVRNPYARAVSAYLHVCFSKRLYDPFEPLVPDVDDLTFLRFLEAVAGMDPYDCNIHYRLQVLPFEDRLVPDFDEIVRLERLADGIARINSRYGHAFEVPPHEKSRARDALAGADGTVADVPFGRLRAGYPKYGRFYDDRALELVESIYEPDIARYGYERPDLS